MAYLDGKPVILLLTYMTTLKSIFIPDIIINNYVNGRQFSFEIIFGFWSGL